MKFSFVLYLNPPPLIKLAHTLCITYTHHRLHLTHHPLSSVGPLDTGRSRIFLAKGLWSLLVKWGGPLVDQPRVWRCGCGTGQSAGGLWACWPLKRQPPQSEGQGEQAWALFSVHHCLIMGEGSGSGGGEGGREGGGLELWGIMEDFYHRLGTFSFILSRYLTIVAFFSRLTSTEDTGMWILSFKKNYILI